jgi:hypothetical protein
VGRGPGLWGRDWGFGFGFGFGFGSRFGEFDRLFSLQSSGFGLWSLVFGLWSLVFGLWSLVFGLWSLKNDPPTYRGAKVDFVNQRFSGFGFRAWGIDGGEGVEA